VLCWLAAVIVAGKIDPKWSAPFLSPPLLVSQNLQQLGEGLLEGTLRSSWHLLQGVVWGTVAGVLLGFLLSHAKWLHQWTTWHLTVVSAIPPLLLIEVFKQVARLPGFPAITVRDEIAFKSSIAMASWAVTWPILTATAHALSRIDKEYRHSIRLLGARSLLERLRYIELPIIIPPALANLRIGLVIGLILLIIGERQGGPADFPTIGYYFGAYSEAYKLQSLMALLVFTSLLIIGFEAGLRIIEARFVTTRAKESHIPSPGADPRLSSTDVRRKFLEDFERERETKWPSCTVWDPEVWVVGGGRIAIQSALLGKTYGDSTALKPEGKVNISPGEFVSLIGRSGAGKSTYLKLLLGFEEPDPVDGSILNIGGIDVLGSSGRDGRALVDEKIAYVAQRPQLLPDRTVEQNILFGIRQQWKHAQSGNLKLDNRSLRVLTEYMLWLCGGVEPLKWKWSARTETSPLGLLVRFVAIDEKMTSYPAELSGGEAQRVHLLRWLVLGRPVMFMDEAFSALDQPLKGMVRDAIQRHAKALGMTIVNVSHDRADVLQVSDRVIFIDEGQIVADAPPKELYYSPKTHDLAVFLGHTNIFSISTPIAKGGCGIAIVKDAYRNNEFTVPVAITLSEGIIGYESEMDESCRTIFIPRSDVNIVRLSGRRTASKGDNARSFSIDHLRFTGTHYDVRLSLVTESGETFRIDSVIQDDELQVLAEKAGSEVDNIHGMEAEIVIRRGVIIREQVNA
jgi:ABC-type Fe3+/spermidine/putrescine transport system ATPase subunit/ABC-type nitrate/sulfonate/bicarbonate transport system permease component